MNNLVDCVENLQKLSVLAVSMVKDNESRRSKSLSHLKRSCPIPALRRSLRLCNGPDVNARTSR